MREVDACEADTQSLQLALTLLSAEGDTSHPLHAWASTLPRNPLNLLMWSRQMVHAGLVFGAGDSHVEAVGAWIAGRLALLRIARSRRRGAAAGGPDVCGRSLRTR